MMKKLESIARLIKIEHTLFSLPLIFSGVLLAYRGFPKMILILWILVCGISARTVAMILNRIIDIEIDALNPRTKDRELPSGRLSKQSAVALLIFALIIYFFSAYMISNFCLMLSPIPLIIFIFYPYAKRFTTFAHFGVGLGLSMAPLGGWIAVKNSFDGILPGALLSFFTLFWVSGFDIIYSTLDENFDRKQNLFSFVVKYGKKKALKISAFLHLLGFLMLLILFIFEIKSIYAFPFLLISGYLLYLEQKKSDDVELAFFKINAVVGFAVFIMVLTGVYFT